MADKIDREKIRRVLNQFEDIPDVSEFALPLDLGEFKISLTGDGHVSIWRPDGEGGFFNKAKFLDVVRAFYDKEF